MSGLESLCSFLLCEHMALPLTSPSRWPAVRLAFCLQSDFRVSSQSIHSVTLPWQTGICDRELVSGGHAPASLWSHWWPTLPWLPASTLWRMTSSDRHPENSLCYLLCFQLSTLLLPLLPHCKLYMEDDSIACYLLTRNRGLLSLREPMLQVWGILKIFFLENILRARYYAYKH